MFNLFILFCKFNKVYCVNLKVNYETCSPMRNKCTSHSPRQLILILINKVNFVIAAMLCNTKKQKPNLPPICFYCKVVLTNIWKCMNNYIWYQSFTYLSLIHTVPVYAPVRPGSLQPVDRGDPGRIGTEFDFVHIFPAVLRTKESLGQKLITVYPGNATVCNGAFLV